MSSEEPSRPSEEDAYRREVYQIREDQELTLSEKFNRLLTLGCEYLGVENGHIKRIDKERGIHDVIASAGGEGELLEVGAQHTHATTFCRRTIEQDSPLAISHASEQGWTDDPAYERHGLECYLGATISVEGTTYGTVCFVSETPYDRDFSSSERALVELIAGVVGTEIEAKRYEYKLTDHERLNAVLNRVLRHNLRNSMNTVSGYAELLTKRLTGDDQELAKRIVTCADNLIELGETARKLEKVTRDASPPEKQEVGPLISDVAAELRNRHPEAAVAVELPDSPAVFANEYLKPALYELGENAITHADKDPELELSLHSETAQDDWVVIRVDDNGSGLPELERNILRGQMETQLEHSQGLGLWFVYWTVIRSGGKLTVAVDDGTTISIWLHSEDLPEDDLQWYLDLPLENDLI
ncbi:sensor histidine kinase [Halobellus ordinarius]|uniref:sensor histidine kinase n=1 Tax=Halobellus ordinarius TaxID=3075120 RepID=UPI0028807A39|nr:GAF domain-containing sensor histidine kinase [Halobellus sp. ZY16]